MRYRLEEDTSFQEPSNKLPNPNKQSVYCNLMSCVLYILIIGRIVDQSIASESSNQFLFFGLSLVLEILLSSLFDLGQIQA